MIPDSDNKKDITIKNPGKAVVLGFSGGVDSSVAALLLKEKGYDVIALYFDVLEDEGYSSYKIARENADIIGIPLIYRKECTRFSETVISYFCNEYKNCRTPNPCVFCNPNFKLKLLCEEADRIGAKYIATGHYANISEGLISKAANLSKDQSYMLCAVPENIRKKIIFPLGNFASKDEIRSVAQSFGLTNSNKKDSQDICFVPEGDYISVLKERNILCQKGSFIDENGLMLGSTNELYSYTVGQRKGLGIAVGKPVFVSEINPEKGYVRLSENDALFKTKVYIDNPVLYKKTDDGQYYVKLRYSAKESCALLQITEDAACLFFDQPQRAPAPGQFAVLYSNGVIYGYGIIIGSEK